MKIFSKINRAFVAKKKLSLLLTFLCASLMTFAVEKIYDTNLATLEGTSATATSGTASAAIDGNMGSRWESEHGVDPQVWTLDLGQQRIFSMIKIFWEGAYGKSFTIDVSNDETAWTTVKTVADQELSGFPYEQTLEFDETTAQYVRFTGTARGTVYGYSFWEFEVYLPASSVLTNIDLSASSIHALVGESITLTAQGRDQLGEPLDAVINFEVSPADAGNFSGNVFTFAKLGAAEITARSGDVSANVSVYCVPSEDLAFEKTCSAGIYQDANTPDRAVNGNPNNFWTSFGQGISDDWWWSVDLGKNYDITDIFIHFNDCWGAYSIYSSKDGSSWDAVVESETAASNSSKSYSSLNVTGRYLKVVSAVSQIGIREFKVFGTESQDPATAVDETNVSEKAVKMVVNGQLVIIKNGVRYNVLGAKL